MAQDDPMTELVQSLGLAVALVDFETWDIEFENAKFFQWCPPNGDVDAPLPKRLKAMNEDRASERLRNGRPYKVEYETRSGARTRWLDVEIRPLPEMAGSRAIVECFDISKRKQSEYMLESYSQVSERNTRELQREKDRVEKLLLNIMPRSVYEEMKDYGTTTPARFDAATVLLLDFVGFTDMAVSREPGELISELNDIFSAFDRVVELFDSERIKTMGDAYMAVSGVPEGNPDHAQNIARVALRLKRYIERRNTAHAIAWTCRIGINSGPVIGSIVGIQKYVYDIFGPGVNLASRMEAQCEPMEITLCDDTYELLKDDFVMNERGEADIKGFGRKMLYTLERERDHTMIKRDTRF